MDAAMIKGVSGASMDSQRGTLNKDFRVLNLDPETRIKSGGNDRTPHQKISGKASREHVKKRVL